MKSWVFFLNKIHIIFKASNFRGFFDVIKYTTLFLQTKVLHL
jgi:hypothetical protein